ncbi:hypothetical protein SO802_013746 [Lithocarpus litseifolius]|uniref:BUD13 homolog n=1 Tax=Lithocarpus litseifolius TaxID=425828 RepID=A0AAW2DA49_9ROSI
MAAAASSGSNSLKEYLKRYGINDEEDKKKKKKKKKVQSKPDATGLSVVDEDPVWQKTVNLEEENSGDSADEEKPQVNEDIEVKRMRRLEQLRARRAYNAISEDGSGWVSLSPKCLNSNDPNSDMSPPRKQRIRNDTPSPEPEQNSGRDNIDFSPPRPNLNNDMSPPRKRRVRNDSPSPEPGVKLSTDLLNSDMSPPRRRQVLADNDRRNPDISPPRRGRRGSPYQDDFHASLGSDLSPPRKSRKDLGRPGSPDLSPPRRRSTETNASHASLLPDLSPPRKSRKEAAVEEQRKTGLISGKDMREEIARTKKNDLLRFNEMDPSISGRGAEPTYRDKKGERISKEEFLKLRKKVKVEEKPKEIKLEWGKGLAQKREAEARLQELESEKDKPFARTRDDPELDKMLRERIRDGDPMAHLVKKKRPELVLPNLGDNEKMKESGFVVPQDIPDHSWLKRRLDAAPNRYGIRPGRHWDGVDRSTGFEKGLFKRMNEKRATETEAYLWSVSDM